MALPTVSALIGLKVAGLERFREKYNLSGATAPRTVHAKAEISTSYETLDFETVDEEGALFLAVNHDATNTVRLRNVGGVDQFAELRPGEVMLMRLATLLATPPIEAHTDAGTATLEFIAIEDT